MWKKIRRSLMLALIAGPGMVLAARMAWDVSVPFSAGLPRAEANGGDAAAVMLVSLLFTMLALFTGFGWLVFRRRSGEATPEQALMEETRRSEEKGNAPRASQAEPPEKSPAAPWERPADWWKKEAL